MPRAVKLNSSMLEVCI